MSAQNRKISAYEIIQGYNLKGKNAIVTGGLKGIGVETVKALAKAGASVLIATRNISNAKEVVEKLMKETENNLIECEVLDLSSLKSVKNFVNNYLKRDKPLHYLINNAGIFNAPKQLTEDGIELQFASNHVGHFALTISLIPALKKAGKARVVNLSSIGHFYSDVHFDDINFEKREYNGIHSYGQSKTANILFTVGLNKYYGVDGIKSFAVHPGAIFTDLVKHCSKDILRSSQFIDGNGNLNPHVITPEQGAATTVWAAISEELDNVDVVYLEDCHVSHQLTEDECKDAFKNGFKDGYAAYAVNPTNADKLWDISVKMIKNIFSDVLN